MIEGRIMGPEVFIILPSIVLPSGFAFSLCLLRFLLQKLLTEKFSETTDDERRIGALRSANRKLEISNPKLLIRSNSKPKKRPDFVQAC
jgi:hypothetical protein